MYANEERPVPHIMVPDNSMSPLLCKEWDFAKASFHTAKTRCNITPGLNKLFTIFFYADGFL